MKSVIFVLLGISCIALQHCNAAAINADSLDVQWRNFKNEYHKTYSSDKEDEFRKEIFRQNLEIIEAHNEKYRNHEVTWEMGLNEFTDLTSTEIKERLGFGKKIALFVAESPLDVEWENFKTNFNKSYDTATEEKFRKEIFRRRLEGINAHNEKYRNHEVTWEMGVNIFTDLTAEEIRFRLGFGLRYKNVPFDTEWKNFKAKYNKIYNSDEESFRMEIFRQNLEIIEAHNEKYRNHEVTWEMGLNEFSDFTADEIKERLGFGTKMVLLVSQSPLDVEWENFKTNFNKSYDTATEEKFRKEIFRRRLEGINAHNEKYRNHEVTWEVGVNTFTDLTAEEFRFRLGFGLRYKNVTFETEWNNFKAKYNKIYNSDEEKFRMEIFRQNLEIIEAHNEKYRNHEVTWEMGLNEFSDFTADEIKERLGFGTKMALLVSQSPLDVEWENFKTNFNKSYDTATEEKFRKEIFRRRLEGINAHNEKYRNHEVTWEMGVNTLTDLTAEEIRFRLHFGRRYKNVPFDTEWKNFKAKYNKIYNSDEESFRMEIFRQNLEIIEAHNEKYRNHEVTWEMGTNEFTDLTADEIKERLGFGKRTAQLIALGPLDAAWENFKTEYHKSYPSDEEQYRKEIFRKNFEEINAHNEKFHNHEVTWEMGINDFADLTSEEFNERLGLRVGLGLTSKLSRSLPVTSKKTTTEFKELPNEVDWYKYGFQTPVMNQGVCGSCYAMAVTGAIESHYYIKHKEFIKLSQQELVDCSKTYGNMGCAYGDLKNSFTYILENGIGTYDQNPYKGWEGKCKNDTTPRYHINGFIQTAAEDEEDLKRAVASGPVIAVINTGLTSFQYYKGGVYYDENCFIDPTSVNHFVLVLGYGTNKDGDDYWLIKSSWGTNWGLGGYMYMARNRGNQCGVATEAMYPVL